MIIKTQKEFDAIGKDGITAVKGDLKIVCEIVTKTKIIVTNGCLEAGDISADDISAYDIDAHNIDAHNISAYDIYAHDIDAHNIIVYDIDAYDIYAHDIDAHDIVAHDISADNLRYSTLCGTYKGINYRATKTEGGE